MPPPPHKEVPPHTPQARMWKLTLAYDGASFCGWQVQPGRSTVQGELAAAIERVTGERVLPQGSGRTDTGVHAQAQVASFALHAPIPPGNLQRALNRTLPAAIRVLAAEYADANFHARHSARGKRYQYRIYRGEICPPMLARYVYALPWPLDLAAMQAAAVHALGTHDFTSFAAADPDRAERLAASAGKSEPEMGTTRTGNVRVVTTSQWEQSGDLLVYIVEANGFLHHMVRNLVGTFLEVGRGQRRAEDIPAILDSRSRSQAGATAPARGLFLARVYY